MYGLTRTGRHPSGTLQASILFWMSQTLLYESHEGRDYVSACLLPDQDPTPSRCKVFLEELCQML